MYDFRDKKDIARFKARLQEARKGKHYNQESFAEALHFSCRSSVGNWESQKSPALPTLENFVAICRLLEADPNFMLGVSEIASEKDAAISDATGLSCDNVRRLREESGSRELINYILSSDQLHELLKRAKQICCYSCLSQAMETSFTAGTRKQMQKAFDRFYRDVFPLEMSAERFAEYLRREIRWDPGKCSVDDFVRAALTDNEYQNILFTYPDFEARTAREKYEILLADLAQTSYDYLMGQPMMELAEREITAALDRMVKGYLHAEAAKLRQRLHAGVPRKDESV